MVKKIKAKPAKKVARLLQGFDGSYHVVVGNDQIAKFSLTLTQARKWADKNKYELR